MSSGRRWRIATTFGWVHLEQRSASQSGQVEHFTAQAAPNASGDGELARFHLLSELEHSSAARAALTELSAGGRGEEMSRFGVAEQSGSEARTAELSRVLLSEIAVGAVELRFEPFAGFLHERAPLDIELPRLAPANRTQPETSFIAVRLIDQRGAAIVGRPFIIELPDGAVHRGVTDADGFARVRGFTKDGTAKVTFPTLDELDLTTKNAAERVIIPVGEKPAEAEEAAPASEEAAEPAEAEPEAPQTPELELLAAAQALLHFVELALVDTDGQPVVNEAVLVVDSTGKQFRVNSDARGIVRIEGLEAGVARVELPERDGSEWLIDQAS